MHVLRSLRASLECSMNELVLSTACARLKLLHTYSHTMGAVEDGCRPIPLLAEWLQQYVCDS